MTNKTDYWSDYWQHDGKGGEVFVNNKGERPAYIADHWSSQLVAVPEGGRMLDIASGAGSIYESLTDERRASVSLFASDISCNALEILKKKIPHANVVVCSSIELPYEDQSFDMVVSQFGIEYAGIDAFSEAARLVAPGGYLSILSHYENGYIDQRNAAFLSGAKLALSCGYIETAIELTKAIFSGSKTKIRKAEKPFIASQIVLAKSFKENPEGIHKHLYFGYRKMYMKIQNYQERDVIAWLNAMKADIKKNIIKVTEIRKVSLRHSDMDTLRGLLSAEGLIDIGISTLTIPDYEDIVAWTVSARRLEA